MSVLADCAEVCGAEDRRDCYEMQNSTNEELWERARNAMLGKPLHRPEGNCTCSCHDEFDE